MKDTFELRVRAASTAGWWTVLAISGVITLFYCGYLFAASAHPSWVMSMWGANMDWPEILKIWFHTLVVMKLFLWTLITAVIWITLWAKQLRKQGE